MKKIIRVTLLFTILFLISCSPVLAGGILYRYEASQWELYPPDQEESFIHYRDNLENIIVSLRMNESLTGEKLLYIFPVPADALKVKTNDYPGYPYFSATSLNEKAVLFTSSSLDLFRLSQIFYLFHPLVEVNLAPGMGAWISIENNLQTFRVVDENGLADYLKRLKFTPDDYYLSYIREYPPIGFSYVVSTVGDLEKFRTEQRTKKMGENVIWLNVTFPSRKIFYPLKTPLSYKYKTNINILDFVTPENQLPGIKLSYSWRDDYQFDRKMKNFLGLNGNTPLKYTNIRIANAKSSPTEDLWLVFGKPFQVTMADFIIESRSQDTDWIYLLIIFVIFSCLASFLAGLLVLRKTTLKKYLMMSLGLFNFFTLIGFSTAALISLKHIRMRDGLELKGERKLLFIVVFSLIFLGFTYVFQFVVRSLL